MRFPGPELGSRETNAFNNFARLLFSLVMASAMLTIIGFSVAAIYNPKPDTRYYGQLIYPGTPEPKERMIFVVAVFAAPILAWLAWRVMGGIARWPPRLTRLLVLTSLTVLFAGEVLIVHRSDFLRFTVFEVLTRLYMQLLATATGIIVMLYVILWPRLYRGRRGRLLGGLVAGFLISLALVHAASRIHTLSTLQIPGWGGAHFGAVFYSVTQVVNGKTVLADLPAQYGLYAELLGPALLGACTVLRFTTIMAVLQLLASLGVIFVARRLVRSNLLFLLTGFALSILVGEMWLFGMNLADPYYQYFPLRFIFPVTALIILNWFLKRPDQPMLAFALLGAVSGVACIWNLDTGVPVFGATFTYLLSRVVAPPNGTDRRKAASLLVWMTAICISVVAVFFVYLRIKAGKTLQLHQLLEYQKVFYVAGINLLPMPASFHPWVLVSAIYLAGILVYIGDLQRRVPDKSSTLMFFLSILGIGLFSYYQGRSHEFVFTIVIWPAVLIGFALLDRIRRMCAARLLPRTSILAVAPLILLATLFSWSSVLLLPRIVQSIGQNLSGVSTPAGAKLKDAISFIRKNAGQHRRAIILSSEQGIYFGEAHLASAIDGPGVIEMMLRSESDRFMEEVLTAQDVPLFVDIDESGKVSGRWRWILNKYEIVERSPLGVIARAQVVAKRPIR